MVVPVAASLVTTPFVTATMAVAVTIAAEWNSVTGPAAVLRNTRTGKSGRDHR